MQTKADILKNWLATQGDVVASVGHYLSPLRDSAAGQEQDPSLIDDINYVYRLGTEIRDLDAPRLNGRLQSIGLTAYYQFLMSPHHALVHLATMQTIPSKRLPSEVFARRFKAAVDEMQEVMLALAKVPPPPFSVTLAAGTPFQAYMLVSTLLHSATEYVRIVDAYLKGAEIFDRYLSRLRPSVHVSLRTNPSRWGKRLQEQFEDVESLFKVDHAAYDREYRDDIHARYLMTEVGCWRLDGSLNDLAAKRDSPIETVPPDERERVVQRFFATVTNPAGKPG